MALLTHMMFLPRIALLYSCTLQGSLVALAQLNSVGVLCSFLVEFHVCDYKLWC
jgi:hypothetical protein